MNRSNSARNVAAAVAALAATLLAGCSWTGSFFSSDKVQYETAKTRPALEVPPDLSQLPRDERFLVPDRPQTITASGQGQRPSTGPVATSAPVVPTNPVAKLERQGNQRWLAVNLPPEKAWPVLVDFWPSVGLKVERRTRTQGCSKPIGPKTAPSCRKTSFAARSAKCSTPSIRPTSRTNTGRGSSAPRKASEIFISHRGMEEVYASPQQDRTFGSRARRSRDGSRDVAAIAGSI